MGHVVFAIFLRDVVEHVGTSIVVEIHVDIGERDTVGVKETFEKEVIFDRVDLRDAETVGHDASGRRTTTRTYAHSELLAGYVDEVLHDEEVAGKTHRLHDI